MKDEGAPDNLAAAAANPAKPADSKLMPPVLWLFVCLGIAGICFFFAKFGESFPSASIDLAMPRREIALRARDWSTKLGYDAQNAKTIASTVFTYDDNAKTFLEYELGQERANALMKSELPVWSWSSRFCREFQIEEMQVGLTPQGELGYFKRSLPNDLPMSSVSHDEARKIAEKFLEETVHHSLATSKLVTDSETKQVNRTDHEFVWQDESKDFKGAKLRSFVYVSGNQPTDYNTFLHVPDRFTRRYAEIRSWNEVLKNISSIIWTILSSSIVFIFCWAFISGRVRWKLALTAGVLGGVLGILSWFDSLPTLLASYETSSPYQSFMTHHLFSMAISVLYRTVVCAVFVGALEPIYRIIFPEKIAFENILLGPAMRTKQVFQGLVAGLSTFGIHTAYVVAFYLIGNSIGFWSPLEVRETSTLSGQWPVYSAMDVGFNASTMEELMYRVLALAMFKQLTKNFWIANLLQAAAWAFMHSDYPQEPPYARGIELTIGGFFYGYVLRRFGLLATLVAHYTYDAFLGVTPLIASGRVSDWLAASLAIAPAVVALILCVVLILWRGQRKDVSSLTNEHVSDLRKHEPPKEVHIPVSFHYHPVSNKVLSWLVVLGVIGGIAATTLPLHTVGDENVVHVDRAEATHVATTYLAQNGISTAGFKSVAFMADDSDDNELQYVFESVPYDKAVQLIMNIEPRLIWKVRFFKPSSPEEFYVAITPQGAPLGQYVIEEEEAPGGKLTQDQALTLVTTYLDKEHPEYAPYVLDDATKHEHKNRNDYDFSFKVPRLKVKDAEFKVYSGTVGDYISGFSRSWQIPDEWIFARKKEEPKDHIFSLVRNGMFAILFLVTLWWIVAILRSNAVRWRIPIVLAMVIGLQVLLKQLNLLPIMFSGYQSEVKLTAFYIDQAVQYLTSVLSGAASIGLMAAFAVGAYRIMEPDVPITALIKAVYPGRGIAPMQTRRIWLDAVVVGYSFCLIFAGLTRAIDAVSNPLSPAVHPVVLGTVRSAGDQFSPALGSILSSLGWAITAVLVVAIIWNVKQKVFGNSGWKMFCAFAICIMIGLSSTRYLQDWVSTVVNTVLGGWLAYLFVARWARLNPLTYLLVGLFGGLAEVAYSLSLHGYQVFYPDITLLILVILAPVAYTGWLYFGPQHTTDFE